MTNENEKGRDMLTSADDKSENKTEQDVNLEGNSISEKTSSEETAPKEELPTGTIPQTEVGNVSLAENSEDSEIPEVRDDDSAEDQIETESNKENLEETITEVGEVKGEQESVEEGVGKVTISETSIESGSTTVEEVDKAPISEDSGETESATLPEEEEEHKDSKLEETSRPESKKLESEVDLAEKHDDHHEEEEHEEEVDYTTMSKAELVEVIKVLSHDNNIEKSDRTARIIKPIFEEIQKAERAVALKKFIEDDGKEEDFDYKYDELDNRFDANLKLIRDRRSEFIRNKEKQKEVNLKTKEEILEKLRQFVDSDETNISFEKFKEIQEEWRHVGPIPGSYVKTLWANYNALVDRFYDNRSIYFELKELDRRKNLESKLEICEKAEKLASAENLKEAIKELNELHHEFKHLGPVPQSEQEALWQRFKAASDAVYDHRKEFVDKLKVELEENLKVKEVLAEEVQTYLEFDSDRIKEWNSKTKEILELQKRWEAGGGLPRAKAKDVNRKFWNAFKGFFHNKGEFFKKLDAKREENLEKKKQMVAKAVELKDSTDWQQTTNLFKKLQSDWREIGPVPEKYRESVYKEFKAACDFFFDQKRAGHGEVEKEFEENLSKKEAICKEIMSMADATEKDMDKFRGLQSSFNETGFVPRKNINSIKKTYAEAVDKFIGSLEGFSDEDKNKLQLENQLNKLIQGPNAEQKLYRKEQAVRRQIHQMENDIAVWRNNLEFFANSKTANKLKEEFESKIESATKELQSLKQQLKIIRRAT